MGLDMTLYRKTHVNNYEFYKPEFRHKLTIECGPASTQINPDKVREVIEEVAYWRKENHIHKWFVDNVQNGVDDCGEYKVPVEKLSELYALCDAVVKKEKRPSELPTQGGFFFGPTDYDESYFDGCRETMNMIGPHLNDKENEFYYSSSW